ncbi:hypothetical protein AN220_00605 [Streptomyces nanshensis]|nr:hypothetical protein AN220_00605 [Streptomyces nanshensis]
MINNDWKKSTYSNADGGNCVECRADVGTSPAVFVRDTQNRHLGALDFDPTAFAAFGQVLRATVV